MRWVTALRAQPTLRLLRLHEGLARELLDVLEVDLVAVGLGDVEAVDDLDGLANVLRAALRVERAVGGEHHLVHAEELEPANGCRARAEHRSVGVEIFLELVDRPLLETLE